MITEPSAQLRASQDAASFDPPTPRACGAIAMTILAPLWLAGVLLTLFVVDGPLSEWIRQSGVGAYVHGSRVALFVKWFGNMQVALIALPIAWIIYQLDWRVPAILLLAGVPGLFNSLLKWVMGRVRPFTGLGVFDFQFFRNGWHGLFNQKNFSFASGHACQAFATATALAILFPGQRRWFYLVALLVALQRFGANDHYASEALAGAGIGFFGVQMLWRLLPSVSRRGQLTDSTSPPVRGLSCGKEIGVMSDSTSAVFVSLVIPCFNEQESVPTLLQRVEQSLQQVGKPFEVVIIDDGSTDNTPKLLADAMTTRPWLRVIRMNKNSGQSAAFEAGFAAARGEIIATIDADLQNDPEEIPRLIPMLDEQKVDMITGWRKDRQDTKFRKWQSRQANKIRNWISQETVNDSASSLKIYRASAIKGLRLFNGAHRFFPTLVKMRGYTCCETPVKHSQRFAGTAKYGFRNRAFRAFIDLLAVRWMKSRYLRYETTEIKPPQP